jgi:hypothetical protein
MNELKYKVDDISVIAGKRGMGKTYLSKYLIQKYVHTNAEIKILDVNDEYGDMEIENVEIIPISDKLDLMKKVNTTIDYAMRNENVIVVLDDIDLLIDQYKIPDSILNCLIIGRHKNVGMIFIFRRMNSIHKQIIFNANHFYIFKSKLFLDRDYFAKQLDADFDIINLKQYEFRYLNSLSDLTFTGKIKNNKIEVIY